MTSILMVCLGNICRSPLAHGILASKLDPNSFYVDSAGTGNYHVGESPDQRSISVAKKHGIDISNQVVRQFKTSDFDTFDHIFAMDQSNYDNIIKLARNPEDKAKVKRILDLDTSSTTSIVPDPYHGDISDFEQVYQLLEKPCQILADQLQNS
ncbi:low molecular weight protein-tyrosine-phosphatase [Sediminibacter sp. Hel_I_10]|uniref:low molecular weight protein-tyrosine-phosphatase n=1 Tax=Sediminibacter sp. Hel_I_10 TaxID=1392490 RepID=UPI00047D002F|nr:low molecular weight protein-tyrosine-phosphatase [Sediminibacter sp. Hel_I_10]